jgi:hypothetical protein
VLNLFHQFISKLVLSFRNIIIIDLIHVQLLSLARNTQLTIQSFLIQFLFLLFGLILKHCSFFVISETTRKRVVLLNAELIIEFLDLGLSLRRGVTDL